MSQQASPAGKRCRSAAPQRSKPFKNPSSNVLAGMSAEHKLRCLTCRKRRVKCDRAAPVCGACSRLRLECFYRPGTEQFLWLPIGQVDIDGEPLGDQISDQNAKVSDYSQFKKPPQARRRTLSTVDKERNAMCQQLLQSTQQMDVDDILRSLSKSAEAGLKAVSMGPFTAFPIQTAQVMDPSLITQDPSCTVSAESENSFNNDSSPSLRVSDASFGTPVDISSPTTQAPVSEFRCQSNIDINVDNLLSIQSDWEENFPSAPGFDALPLHCNQQSSSYSFDTLELQPEADPFQLPSPLSVHLPFLWSSHILERVPKDTFFLLEYYGSRMLFFLSPFPSQKPPWKIMHYPSVLETATALLLNESVKHAQLALLYVILAISSFHLDWNATANEQMQTGSNIDSGGNTRSYWWLVGEKFEQNAKLHLQLALKDEFSGAAKAKYKHILMTLLCMVTICVLKGEMDDGRCFLLDAERAIRLRGLSKPHVSKKARLLHNIFLYNRIIEESTFVYSEMDKSRSIRARGPSIQPILPSDDIVYAASLDCNNQGCCNCLVNNPNTIGSQRSLSEQLITNDGVWFERIYGIPITLMSLISQVTSLARDADSQRSSSTAADMQYIMSFAHRAHTLEDLICGFRWEPIQETQDESYTPMELLSSSQPSCPTKQASVHGNMMCHLVSAMHQALLIFFYRRVRKLNSYALQPFVKRTISELIAFQRAKEENNIVTPEICWPGFIAGCEALEEEDRRQIRQWFRQSGRGWRNFDKVGQIMEKFWRSREHQGGTGGAGSRAGEVTWEHFFERHRIAIICT